MRFLKRNFIGMKDDPVFLAATVIFMYLLPPVLAKLEPSCSKRWRRVRR